MLIDLTTKQTINYVVLILNNIISWKLLLCTIILYRKLMLVYLVRNLVTIFVA